MYNLSPRSHEASVCAHARLQTIKVALWPHRTSVDKTSIERYLFRMSIVLLRDTSAVPRWAVRSAGRSPALQAGGRGFKSHTVHSFCWLVFFLPLGRHSTYCNRSVEYAALLFRSSRMKAQGALCRCTAPAGRRRPHQTVSGDTEDDASTHLL